MEQNREQGKAMPMRINNYHLSSLPVSPGTLGPEPAIKDNAPARSLEESSSHTMSPELQRLIALVQQQPQTRAELVQQVKDKLGQGAYTTPAAAEKTAEAILQAAD